MLRGAVDVRRRGVDHQHAAGRRGVHVDVVQPDAGARDDLELGAAASTSASTVVADRTSSASASGTAASSLSRSGPSTQRTST